MIEEGTGPDVVAAAGGQSPAYGYELEIVPVRKVDAFGSLEVGECRTQFAIVGYQTMQGWQVYPRTAPRRSTPC